MNPKLITLLKVTSHQLEMYVFYHYKIWCEMHAKNSCELQNLIANKALFNWWFSEYQKLQDNFIKIAKPYNNIASEYEMRRLYDGEVMQIKHLFSKTLLSAAKRQKPIINQ